jgi:hypothetical protein
MGRRGRFDYDHGRVTRNSVSDRPAKPRRRRLRLRRLFGIGAALAAVSVLGLWIAVNRVEWLGPYVADGLRSVVGVEAVASLEDFAYRVQDRVNRVFRKGEKPRAYWSVPKAPPAPPPKAPPAVPGEAAKPALPPFAPAPVGPSLKAWSAPGDGEWVPLLDVDRPADPPYMAKTLLHPDKNRSWAEVFVVAIDLRRARIYLRPGKKEPAATEPGAEGMSRPGYVPEEHRERVLAAFNGGFKTEHGQYGMFTEGKLLVKAKPDVCAVAAYGDDTIRLATWNELEPTAAQMVWWRETPVCMYEKGKLHWRLADPELAKKWGATLDGETVIRRSAIGISEKGDVLYIAISNHTTARVIADGIAHAGAVTVAQLDVNFSYPKFVTFEKKKKLEEGEAPKRVAIPLADGFEFSEDEYIRAAARRDFFYVMPKDADARTALKSKAE